MGKVIGHGEPGHSGHSGHSVHTDTRARLLTLPLRQVLGLAVCRVLLSIAGNTYLLYLYNNHMHFSFPFRLLFRLLTIDADRGKH